MSRLIHDLDSGLWVNEKHQQIAEIINDFDPRLKLLWIPEGMRTAGDIYPYAVGFFDNEFSEPHILMFVMEKELNEGLIAKLFRMKRAANDPMAEIESLEAAREAIRYKEELDRRAEQADKAKSMFKSPLHTYRLENGKKVHL